MFLMMRSTLSILLAAPQPLRVRPARPCLQIKQKVIDHRSRLHRIRASSEPETPPPNNDGDNSPEAPSPSPPIPSSSSPDDRPPAAAQDANLQLPQAVIAKLRDTVFGLDTLFVTSVENYGNSGVLFKGNLRGSPAAAHAKLTSRLQAELGTAYRLFLLEDQEEKSVAVVIPAESAAQNVDPLAEGALAVVLAATTLVTTLNINGAELFNAALLTAKFDPSLVAAAAPGTAATLAILAAHEAGHAVGAARAGLSLAPAIFVPAGLGLLGSFGAITRITSAVPNRVALATMAAPGPLSGAAVAAAVMLTGLIATAAGVGGVELDSASFRESLLVGGLARGVLGEQVFTAAAVDCNPLFVAGWAGLIINAINAIPAGELDGGRIFLALFGRRAASRMSALSFFLLGIAGFSSSLSLFWLLLVLTLQRGPVVPCDEELTPPPEGGWVKTACFAALALPLLVLVPFPFAPGGGLGGDELGGMLPPTF